MISNALTIQSAVVGSMPQETHVASHPDTFEVRFSPGDFQSGLFALKDIKRGDVVASIRGWIPGTRTRTSIQLGEKEHVEFNSDLVFANHSCSPNIALHVSSPRRENWAAVALKDIKAGEPVTWFYPSTEWDAWGGGFKCQCGSENCIGQYAGSKALSLATLEARGHVNDHVRRLIRGRGDVTKLRGSTL